MIISRAIVGHATEAEQHNTGLDALCPIGSIIQFSKGIWTISNDVTFFKSGVCNSDVLSHLVDTTANFTSVVVGDVCKKVASGDYASVTVKTSTTDLTLDWDLFPLGNEAYQIWREVSPTIFNTGDTIRWAVCNGATVADSESVFLGKALPTLAPATNPYRQYWIRIK